MSLNYRALKLLVQLPLVAMLLRCSCLAQGEGDAVRQMLATGHGFSLFVICSHVKLERKMTAALKPTPHGRVYEPWPRLMYRRKQCGLEIPATTGFTPSMGIRNSFGTSGKSVRPSIGAMPREMMWPISITSFADAPSQPAHHRASANEILRRSCAIAAADRNLSLHSAVVRRPVCRDGGSGMVAELVFYLLTASLFALGLWSAVNLF
jgi:hypothetical protein